MRLGPLQWAFIAVATVTIVVMAPSENENDSANLARPAKQRAGAAATSGDKQRQPQVGHVKLERLAASGRLPNEGATRSNAFNIISWNVPPPIPRYVPPPQPVAPPQVAPVPTAPPLPFTFLGRYSDESSLLIILAKGERVYTVAVGEVIENTYRVEKFSEGVVTFIYLPLNISQTLRIGES